jgi:hypothetical protein
MNGHLLIIRGMVLHRQRTGIYSRNYNKERAVKQESRMGGG